MIRVVRTSDTFVDQKGAQGRRLQLLVERGDAAALSLPAIERAGAFSRVPAGRYVAHMDVTRLRPKGPPIQVVRIRDVPLRGELNQRHLIHVANWPHQLEGCIAPGLDWFQSIGVQKSRLAMETIFAFLGGFRDGRSLSVVVEDGGHG